MARNLKKDYIKKILSMEAPNGYKFDIANYTCWMNYEDKARLANFLANDKGEHGYHTWYTSTGRTKAWCK